MEWTDDGIVLSLRPLGESSSILECLTRDYGRHAGLIRGGSSRKMGSMLQPGNTLRVHWRARLAEHLGSFTVEPHHTRAGAILETRDALMGVNAFTGVALAVLPEREPHATVFEAGEILLDAMAGDTFDHWGPLYVRWEMGVLDALGFGLDLSRCAATDSSDDLRYVSPKSGRAVSGAAGAPYRGKLFHLPPYLLASQNAEPTLRDIVAGLKLTAHFLLERVLRPHGRDLPPARLRLTEIAARESA
ncbi:MAG: DNA repair protein RecO [Rhizomicrobium sp.]|jgi:DNA repair protein RecO (recombination protein O)